MEKLVKKEQLYINCEVRDLVTGKLYTYLMKHPKCESEGIFLDNLTNKPIRLCISLLLNSNYSVGKYTDEDYRREMLDMIDSNIKECEERMKYLKKQKEKYTNWITNKENKKLMKTFEIWMEGYSITGGYGKHILLGTSKGETFREAVINWINKNPDQKSLFNEENLTIWSCRLFPTEAEAAKSFG